MFIVIGTGIIMAIITLIIELIYYNVRKPPPRQQLDVGSTTTIVSSNTDHHKLDEVYKLATFYKFLNLFNIIHFIFRIFTAKESPTF